MANESNGDDLLIKVKGVILSYPHLFEPYRARNAKPGDKLKYSSKFLFDKKDPAAKAQAQAIYAKCVALAKAEFKQSLPAANYCVKDGAQLTEDMHPFYVLSASEDTKPTVVDRRLQAVEAESDLFYPGCVVNVTIRLWPQNNEWGKKINANLIGVQFVKHGERLGGVARPKADEMFDDVSGQFDDDEYEGIPAAASAPSGGDGLGGEDDGINF